jgi:two-component system, chemotaxis family, protein-glutamate methylesterase/glutaminase
LKKIKVLIVDDSDLIRQLLTEIIASSPDLEVVATAVDPIDAREKIKKFHPDVLTLDIEMPKMDGITFLRNLMRLRPMPVVMISTLTEKGAPATLDALEIGAVDYVAKPQGDGWGNLDSYADIIKTKVRNAALANMSARDSFSSQNVTKVKPGTVSSNDKSAQYKLSKVICIGSSTGGTEAIKEVLYGMPLNCPPILIAQHIPAAFSASLAERLNRICDITVREAKAGMPLEAGNAYLAPGDYHLKILEKKGRLVTALDDGEKVCGHKPSVDVLFNSAVACAGSNVVAAILTGMGSDGAMGIKTILDAGGITFAQDEATSVVWGMPGAAVKLDAVQKILPIQRIRSALLRSCER